MIHKRNFIYGEFLDSGKGNMAGIYLVPNESIDLDFMKLVNLLTITVYVTFILGGW